MISKYGQTFASMGEVRRYEQIKPETVRLWDAFEAMRVVLRVMRDKYIPADGDEERDDRESIEAALAMADKVSGREEA